MSLKPGKRYKGAFSELNDRGLLYVVFYTEDGTYINNCNAKSFQVPINALYTVAIFRDRYGTNSFEFQDFIIVETDDTTYEPYHDPQTLDFATPNGFRGILVDSGGNYTDESGQQWICDEADFERGVYVQRVKKIDLKALKFHKSARFNSNGVYFNATINDTAEGNGRRNTISNIGTCDNPYASAGDFCLGFQQYERKRCSGIGF